MSGSLSSDFFKIFPNPSNFAQFLDKITLINTFEYSLDPSTYLESADQIYYVIRNHFLYDALLTHAVVPLIINFGTYLGFRVDREEVERARMDRRFSHNDVARLLLIILNDFKSEVLALDSLEEKSELFNALTREIMVLGLDFYYGIKLFSYFHEYAHILYGHFNYDRKTNLKMEVEADSFAINALAYNTLEYYKGHNNPLFKAICGLRITAPLVYFLIKIALIDRQSDTQPSYVFRWEFSKRIVEVQLLKHGLLQTMHDFLVDIEELVLNVLNCRNENIEEVTSILKSEATAAEAAEILCHIVNNGTELLSWKFTVDPLMESWYRLVLLR